MEPLNALRASASEADHEHTHAQNRFAVLPTVLRLGADPHLAGRGVTIAFIDSGFSWHPDLARPMNRVLALADLNRSSEPLAPGRQPADADWHGTQTAVVGAGNGHLSDGIYRSLASEANVVLVKVGSGGRITETDIARGIEWVIAHRDRYAIRVASISLGGDAPVSLAESPAARAAEAAVKAGIVIVAAAGNSGCNGRPDPVAPATAPSVITVGGSNDHNRLEPASFDLTCSSYGVTTDGVVKPEVVAPAIWVAAPLVLGTPVYQRAEALSTIAAAPDYQVSELARRLWRVADLQNDLHLEEPEAIRAQVLHRLKMEKIVATHYQHVDGTSFAAPITASLVAQMLEANPRLSPAMVKRILTSTASRISNQPVIRQGYGVLNAALAVAQARREDHPLGDGELAGPMIERNQLVFMYHDHTARRVALVGDFNRWDPAAAPMVQETTGTWVARVELPQPGRHAYKFLVDDKRWIEDPSHGLKEPDGYGGLHSLIQIV